jgi:molybdopterin synthase sulfur carrier subunit
MSVTVRIPTILRTLTGGIAEVAVDGASTLAEVIDSVELAHPGIRARLLDDAGKLRRFVNVYVGDEDVRFASGLQTPTPDGTSVSIIPAVAGG